RFFEKGVLAEDEIRAGLHQAIQRQVFIPLFAVSAETNVGVARLLDFIAKYGSSPLDRAEVPARDAGGLPGVVPLDHPEPVAFVFKTMNEPGVGELSLFRVFAGTVRTGDELLNSTRGGTERLGQLYVLNGHERTPVGRLCAGDLGAVVKLRHTHTGDTLCSARFQVSLPKVDYPRPNIHAALKLRPKGEEDKLALGLATLHLEDPTFHYRVDDELHQTIASGQGEIHLQVIVERLARRFGVKVTLEEPAIPYRETVRGRSESRYRHKKQTGGAGQFAEVWMRIEPAARDHGVEFTESLVGNNVDRVFVPSVEKGVATACREGVLAGYPTVDVKVSLVDGQYHDVDSNEMAFKIAGQMAFKKAAAMARPVLLEPIMAVEVVTPENHMGDVIGDLSSRRGRIEGMEANGNFQNVRAQVPLSEMFGYSTDLRSRTQGRATYTMQFHSYQQVPEAISQEIVKRVRGE
ncbi:MAG: elongation factor G, partial [Actinobacteria bacterium]|nr:elongation factor G [Actinomycetota bacterium]